MREFVEYVCILLHVGTDLKELESHLSMNGYTFGIDKSKNLLFVLAEEVGYVETILDDRNIIHGVKVY
jgi:hypothetical protein